MIVLNAIIVGAGMLVFLVVAAFLIGVCYVVTKDTIRNAGKAG